MASFVKEELQTMLDEQGLLTKRAEATARQRLERQHVGQQMIELQNDPRWRTYVQHINALREPHANKVIYLEKALATTGYLSADDLSKQRFEWVKEKATTDTFDIVKNLVFQLIEQGKPKE